VDKPIEEIEFTIFDTETTGLESASGDRIIEIAAVRIKNTELISTFESLVNPQRPVSDAAFAVNKISADMLKGAPGIEMVMPKFLDFIKGSCLCSYNAGFDLEFVNNELRIIGRALPQEIVVVDILKMARRLIPGLERYALWFVVEKMGIKKEQKHRALDDVKLTLDLFNRLTVILREKGIADFNSFIHLFSISPDFLNDLDNKRVAEIQEAMDLGLKLKITYLSSASAQVTEREVIPKQIRKENNRLYLVGFCCLRNEERSFRLDGILHLKTI
jgi:DNA polymerase III epsilon subunit